MRILASALDEAIQLVRPLADLVGVALKEPEGDVDVHLRADRQRLNQVLLNLLSNAVKFNRPDGRVTIACTRPTVDSSRIEIADTGIGIDPAHVAELFTPFARLGAEERGIEGTGLGLTITKGLVELMEGSLGVRSTPGVGSTFWIELPIAHEQETDLYEQRDGQANEAASAPRRTVLN